MDFSICVNTVGFPKCSQNYFIGDIIFQNFQAAGKNCGPKKLYSSKFKFVYKIMHSPNLSWK